MLIPRFFIPQLPPVNTETIVTIPLSKKTGHCSGNHQTYFFRLCPPGIPYHHPSITITILYSHFPKIILEYNILHEVLLWQFHLLIQNLEEISVLAFCQLMNSPSYCQHNCFMCACSVSLTSESFSKSLIYLLSV